MGNKRRFRTMMGKRFKRTRLRLSLVLVWLAERV